MAGNQPCAHMHIHFLAFGRGHVYVVNYTTRTQQIAGFTLFTDSEVWHVLCALRNAL